MAGKRPEDAQGLILPLPKGGLNPFTQKGEQITLTWNVHFDRDGNGTAHLKEATATGHTPSGIPYKRTLGEPKREA